MKQALHFNDQEAFSCTHVMEDGMPILYVCHEEDGTWQYLCGGQHENDSESCLLVCNGCLRKNDESLQGIEILPAGQCAERESKDQKVWDVYEL